MTGNDHNEPEAPHHQSFVSLNDHQFQNLHRTEVSQPAGQKVFLFHAYKERLNDILQPQQHQQQQALYICRITNRKRDDEETVNS